MRTPLALTALLTTALLLTGCRSTPGAPDPATSADDAHGFVEGASENPEPQLQLAVLDAAGAVAIVDLLTGETSALGDIGPVDAMSSDGRLVAATSGGTTTLVDTGTWTVDHGDHAHYYRAEPRILPGMETSGDTLVSSSEGTTALFTPATGRATLLDRNALARGEVVELGTIESAPHAGAVLPLEELVVASVVEDGTGSVRAFTREGEPTGATEPCTDPRGGAVSRVGAVIGCADGAVLAVTTDGEVAFERIPYPNGSDEATRATAFAQRPGRPVLASVAGDRGAWLLDTRARTWTLVETQRPLVRAVAASDDAGRLVALDTDGRVVVVETESGLVHETEPLVADPGSAALEVDPSRAYLNDPGGAVVHEIDYADAARVARSIDTPVGSRFVAETGR